MQKRLLVRILVLNFAAGSTHATQHRSFHTVLTRLGAKLGNQNAGPATSIQNCTFSKRCQKFALLALCEW
eukprot:2518974-Pleurochrysis_carterae.AAC.1